MTGTSGEGGLTASVNIGSHNARQYTSMGTNQSLGKLGKSKSLSHLKGHGAVRTGGHQKMEGGVYESLTHKTIRPEPHQRDDDALEDNRYRCINETSAWTPSNIFVRDFSTQSVESFVNPSLHLVGMNAEEEAAAAERAAWEDARQVQRKDALVKLASLAEGKYGSMSNMLRAFKKNTGDTITLPEFAEHLRRRNMDSMLPLEDAELVWEQLKATARGSVGVGSLSKVVDETITPKGTSMTSDERDMLALRDFLASELKQRREDGGSEGGGGGGGSEEAEAGAGAGHALQSHEAEMKAAIGQKTFDLDIGAEEMDDVVEGLFSKKHTKESHEKFSRFLRLTNVKLHAIPFYDLRSDELDRYKKNASRLANEMAEPELVTRLHELKQLARTRIAADIDDSRRTRAESQAQEAAKYAFIKPNLSGPNSPIKRAPAVPHDLTHGSGQRLTPLSSPKSPPPSSHRFHASAAAAANGIVTPVRVGGSLEHDHATAAEEPLPESASAAIFGDMDPSMYNSTYTEYYPPLQYEPNKPVTRATVSDSDARCRLSNMRRSLRQKRTEANTKLTRDRLDLERLNARDRQLRGEHGRQEDMIRYQTTVFLHDLKCYKKQPLQTMAKKPNLTKSDAMWGGSQRFDSQSERRAGESRDFGTTFTSSFNGHAPKTEPSIDIEARITNMWNSQGLKR